MSVFRHTCLAILFSISITLSAQIVAPEVTLPAVAVDTTLTTPTPEYFEARIAQGEFTPELFATYGQILVEQENYKRYYELLFTHIHQLREPQILPSDAMVVAPEVAIQQLTALRRTTLQTGDSIKAHTYTYWLGRFCFAAQRYAEAATYLHGIAEEYARLIESYYKSYQFQKADSVLTATSLPHIGYVSSPLAPYIKLWQGQNEEALRLAEQQVGFDLMGYATAVSRNIVFPQTLFNLYTATHQHSQALQLLDIRQRYNTYHSDLSAVGNLPLFTGYIQLGEMDKAEAIALSIVSEANAYTAPNWGYTYPLVLLATDAVESAANEYTSLTADGDFPVSAFLPLLAYHCVRKDFASAQTLLNHHLYLSPDEALALFTTPIYHSLLATPATQAYLHQQLPPTALQRLQQWQR